jgi:hypothetical protein
MVLFQAPGRLYLLEELWDQTSVSHPVTNMYVSKLIPNKEQANAPFG